MSHRINIIVSDDVWGFLKQVPQSERSRIVNRVLREWVRKRRRLDAAAEMDRLRNDPKVKPVASAEIVRWIREEREPLQSGSSGRSPAQIPPPDPAG